MDFIQKRFYFYFLSLILVFFGALSFYIFNPHLGIDLIGGQILEIKTKANIDEIIKKLDFKVFIYPTEGGYLIKGQENLNLLWQEIQKIDKDAQRIRYESISPSLSAELRNKAWLMVILVLIAIGTYVSFAFYKLKKQFSLFNLGFIVIMLLYFMMLLLLLVFMFLLIKIF
jgi:preprotein translocase subunit SecF